MLANIIRNTKKTAIGGGGGGIVTGGDPYYSAVSLLLPMDGTNGSTNFVDSGPNALAVTATSATISTTQSKYGGASGSFNGTSSYLTIPDNNVFHFTDDFTIEAWVYKPSSSGVEAIFTQRNSGADYAPVFFWIYNGVLTCTLSSSGSSWITGANTEFNTGITVPVNTWTHVAVTRSGSNFRLFQNGTLLSSFTSSATLYNSTRSASIGAYATGVNYFNGYIDDLRITKYARYVSSFTPPAQAHPNIYNPYTTLPVSGAALWLDASQQNTIFSDAGTTPVTTSGQSVYQWNDLSGNNRHAVQATSGNRPTWLPPASGQNGLGAVRFSSSLQWLVNSTLALSQPFTVFARIKNNSPQTYPVIFDSSGIASGVRAILFAKRIDSSNTPSLYAGSEQGFGSVLSTGYTNYNIGAVFNGASSIGSLNGTETALTPGSSGGSGGYQISNSYNTSTRFDGDICELVVYPFVADSTQRDSILSYLRTKWGTP